MNTLSVAMIVKNESEVLDRCLSSLSGLYDELIIVDTGSTDDTIEIAKKHNAQIYTFDWIDDFSAARNFSFSFCSCDFILWCDADDIIKPKDHKLIKEYLLKNDWDVLLSRYVYSHDSNDNPELTLKRHRIVRRDNSVRWNDEVHEYMTFNLPRVLHTDIEVHHYRTSEGFTRNLGRNLKILKKMHEKQVNERHTYYYARELADAGETDEAIKIFTDYLNRKSDWEGNIINAYQKLTAIYINLNQYDEALKIAFEGIHYNPHYIEIYNLVAHIYYIKEDWPRVIRWCEMAITIAKPDSLHSILDREYDFVPYDRLCFAYSKVGELKKAHEANTKALSSNPTGNDLERCLFNDRLLVELINVKKDGELKRLNLGCGGKRLENYINCDVVKTEYTDEVFSLVNIPYRENSISGVYCEHVLEHLSHDESHAAIKEMGRVIQPGGELLLFIPDLEQCCWNYLNGNGLVNGFPAKDWYKYTLFGIQRDANGVPADYQIHKTGFSKSEIVKLLEENDFVIDYVEGY